MILPMRSPRMPFLLAVAAAFALTGVSTAAMAAAPSAPAAAMVVPDGFSLDADGSTLVHGGSGFRFPANIAGFTRINEQQFDPSGDYVAIAYQRDLPGGDQVAVRIAVVHNRDMSAADHYVIMKPVAMSYFSAVSVLSEGPVRIAGQPDVEGYRGIFAGVRDGTPWHFSLTTVDYGYWSGRLASAYPETAAGQAENDLEALVAAFRWQRPVRSAR